MRVWITKQALVYGIFELNGKIRKEFHDIFIADSMESFIKPEWHLTREDAVKRAEQMRTDALDALECQKNHLIGLNFYGELQ